MAEDIMVDVVVENEPPVVNVEVANQAGKIIPVLHDDTLVGDGITEPMGVNRDIIPDASSLVSRDEFDAVMTDIQMIIPATANPGNQLADQGFVNSSIQTSTAHFRGNWDTWADVPSDPELYPVDAHGNHAPTPNDYLVVVDDENGGTWRYKYTGDWSEQGKDGWRSEYQINETPLTAVQLAALNSGITAAAVTDIVANKAAVTNLQNTKQNKLTAGNGITIDGDTISASGGGASLPDQTGNENTFLMTDGATPSWSADRLVVKSGSVAIGTSAKAYNVTTNKASVAIGINAKATAVGCVAIGGDSGGSAANYTISIGRLAKAMSQYSIQIGKGTNNDANTFKVGNDNGNFEMMDANGNVPLERLTYVTNQIGDISTALTAILGE